VSTEVTSRAAILVAVASSCLGISGFLIGSFASSVLAPELHAIAFWIGIAMGLGAGLTLLSILYLPRFAWWSRLPPWFRWLANASMVAIACIAISLLPSNPSVGRPTTILVPEFRVIEGWHPKTGQVTFFRAGFSNRGPELAKDVKWSAQMLAGHESEVLPKAFEKLTDLQSIGDLPVGSTFLSEDIGFMPADEEVLINLLDGADYHLYVIYKYQWEDDAGRHEAQSCVYAVLPFEEPTGQQVATRPCTGHNFVRRS